MNCRLLLSDTVNTGGTFVFVQTDCIKDCEREHGRLATSLDAGVYRCHICLCADPDCIKEDHKREHV